MLLAVHLALLVFQRQGDSVEGLAGEGCTVVVQQEGMVAVALRATLVLVERVRLLTFPMVPMERAVLEAVEHKEAAEVVWVFLGKALVAQGVILPGLRQARVAREVLVLLEELTIVGRMAGYTVAEAAV